MANTKTLDQLAINPSLAVTDLMLTQKGVVNYQISFNTLRENVIAEALSRVPAVKVANAAVADLANAVDWANISNKPTGWAWNAITNTPTTLNGYGITDAIHTNTNGAITGNLSVSGTLSAGAFQLSGGSLSFAYGLNAAISVSTGPAGVPAYALSLNAGSPGVDAYERSSSGGTLYLNSGQASGTATASVIIQTPTPSGAATTTLNPLAPRLTVDHKGLNIAAGTATANAGYLFKTTGVPAPAGTDKVVYDGNFYATNFLGKTGTFYNTTNQLVLGTTNTTTISAIAPAASRIYTIADMGATANFILGTGTLTDTAVPRFSGTVGKVVASTITDDGSTLATSAATVNATSATALTLGTNTSTANIQGTSINLGANTTTLTTVTIGGAVTGNILKLAGTAAGTVGISSDVTTGIVNVFTSITTGTVNIATGGASTINLGGTGASVVIGATSGTGAIKTGAGVTQADVFNTVATTVNAFGAATTLNVGLGTLGLAYVGSTTNLAISTAAQTINIGSGVTASGFTKAINIGTNGASGSITNITIGGANATAFSATANTISLSGVNSTLSGSTAVTVDTSASGAVNIGTGAAAKTIVIGNSTGTTAVDIITGSGNFDITAATSSFSGNVVVTGGDIRTGAAIASTLFSNTATGNITIAGGLTTGTFTIGATGSTGAVSLFPATGAQNITLGGATTGTITLGSTGATAVQLPTGKTKIGVTTIIQGGSVSVTLPTVAGTLLSDGIVTLPSGILYSSLTSVGALNGLTVTGTGTNKVELITGTTGPLTLDTGTTGPISIGAGGYAKAISIGNATGSTGVVINSGTGGVTFNEVASGTVKIAASAAPSTDMMQITNAGYPTVVANTNALQIDYYSAQTSTNEASATKINITNTSTSTSTKTNALRVYATGSGTAGVVTNGIKLDIAAADTSTSNAVYVGAGWDAILNYNGTAIINGTGAWNSTINAANDATNNTYYPVFSSVNGAAGTPKTHSGLTYNPSTGTLTATTFSGAIVGYATTLKSSSSTGQMSITGPSAGTTRSKTIRDADDTILELGGNYTPTGTWNWASITGTWPTFNQNTTGTAANVTGTSNATLTSLSALTSVGTGSSTLTIAGTGGLSLTAGSATTGAGTFFKTSATPAPTGTAITCYDGYFYATKIFNALWNDIADFVEAPKDLPIEYGRVYVRTPDYTVAKSSEYMEMGILGIASDTYGFGVGQKKDVNQIPIAIGGFVLAYVDKHYAPGTPLTSSADGGLREISHSDKLEYPERVLATFDRPEPTENWNGLVVDGRCWVKIR